MIGKALSYIWRGIQKFRGSALYRRAFTSKKFRDSEARTPNVPTLDDHADVDLRRVSGDEFIMTVAKGKGQLEEKRELMDTKLMQKRHEENPILSPNERPSLQDLAAEEVEQKLEKLHQQVKEDE